MANVAPPYLTWSARDSVTGELIPGATFQVQGPATGSINISWGTTTTIQDCVTGTCASGDLDDEGGEFTVNQLGTHSIDPSKRYRVRPGTPPAGYVFASADLGWREIPRSSRIL